MTEFDKVLGECPFPTVTRGLEVLETCGMPYSLEDERLYPSSDPTGVSVVHHFRCAVGHGWPQVQGAGVPE